MVLTDNAARDLDAGDEAEAGDRDGSSASFNLGITLL